MPQIVSGGTAGFIPAAEQPRQETAEGSFRFSQASPTFDEA
jgi:hypothetical protein